MEQLVSLIFIRWIIIFLVDNAIQRLNNRSLYNRCFATWTGNRYMYMLLDVLTHAFPRSKLASYFPVHHKLHVLCSQMCCVELELKVVLCKASKGQRVTSMLCRFMS